MAKFHVSFDIKEDKISESRSDDIRSILNSILETNGIKTSNTSWVYSRSGTAKEACDYLIDMLNDKYGSIAASTRTRIFVTEIDTSVNSNAAWLFPICNDDAQADVLQEYLISIA